MDMIGAMAFEAQIRGLVVGRVPASLPINAAYGARAIAKLPIVDLLLERTQMTLAVRYSQPGR